MVTRTVSQSHFYLLLYAIQIRYRAGQGAGDGLHLCLNIAAMLIAFLSLIALVNGMLGGDEQARVVPWNSC